MEFGQDLGRLLATGILNLDVNWSLIGGSRFDLALFVVNVTKEKFPVFILANMPSSGFEGMVTNGPRMFGARLRYSFRAIDRMPHSFAAYV